MRDYAKTCINYFFPNDKRQEPVELQRSLTVYRQHLENLSFANLNVLLVSVSYGLLQFLRN